MAAASPAAASATTSMIVSYYAHCPPCRLHYHISQPLFLFLSRQIWHTHIHQSHRHRCLSTTRPRSISSTNPNPQSQPQQQYQYQPRNLGDFYNELLTAPLPKVAQPEKTSQTQGQRAKRNENEAEALPDFVAAGGRKDIEERARKLFGSIEGSGYQRSTSEMPDATWRTINGVPVPPRPAEPENCCMSGCVHCVWDDYRDDVESWAARLREAQAKGTSESKSRDRKKGRGGAKQDGEVTKTPKIEIPRAEVNAASGSMDDDGGGSEALWQTPSPSPNLGGGDADADDLFQGIPVGIREFMATEKRIRERKKRAKEGLGMVPGEAGTQAQAVGAAG